MAKAIDGKVTIGAFLFMRQETWMNEPEYTIQTTDMGKHGYALIETRQLDFILPSAHNVNLAQVEALVLQKVRVKQDAFDEAARIDQHIQQLLCLPAPASEADILENEVTAAEVAVDDDGIPF